MCCTHSLPPEKFKQIWYFPPTLQEPK
jgi:hypothetical protein